MSRKLASVVRVAKVSDISNSDNLSVAEMEDKGWRVVVSRGSLRAGDLAVYFEIDSALPVEDSRYGFLKQRCLKEFKRGNEVVLSTLRIKTVKLRGVISQGLLLPLSDFPELSGCGVGADVSSILHIEHYDELAAPFRHEHGVFVARSESRGEFPSFIPKTDEERIQNLVEYFETMKGKRFEVTSKDDGTSMTVYYAPSLHEEDPFRVCSRNQDLKRSNENSLWKIANTYELESKLKSLGRELAFQGELVGPGVNGNRDLYKEHEWHVFRIWDIARACFLEASERRALCAELKIPHVPVIEEECPVFDRYRTLDELLSYAEGQTVHGHEREGLVFKEIGTEVPVTFKAVSNRYLLKIK